MPKKTLPGHRVSAASAKAKRDFLSGGNSSVKSLAETTSSEPERSEQIEVEVPAPATSMGRPPLSEEVKRIQVGLRKADLKALDTVLYTWRQHGDSKLNTTSTIRSVLATVLPILEQIEFVENEHELRSQLEELFQSIHS